MGSRVFEEYQSLKSDRDRASSFSTASLGKGKRLYRLNTNIKTVGTYVKYVEDVYSDTLPSESNKQKNARLRDSKFKNAYNQTEQEFIRRSDIVKKAKAYFGNSNDAYVKILLLILLLKEEDATGSSYIYSTNSQLLDAIPFNLKLLMKDNIFSLEPGDSFDIKNTTLTCGLLFGDFDLLNSFIISLNSNENISDFLAEVNTELSANDQTSPINIRVTGLQASSIKEEVKYLYFFHILREVIKTVKYQSLLNGKTTINGTDLLRRVIACIPVDSSNSPKWMSGNSNIKALSYFENFIFSILNVDEQNEIIESIVFGFQIPVL